MLFILDDILEEMAYENKSHFSPHYICNRACINDLKSVSEYLLKLVGAKLNVYYEVECPEGDSDFSVESPLVLPTEPRNCHICNTEYTPDIDRVWIAFDFLPEYRDYVKKKRNYKQKNKHLALV
ncbi:hypothetical protein SAMN05444673_0450 [Bacillus sp. OV166]|uniref:hypothetical protein n=1 Tax=Bacillus sp. OV166 TaxID=1882763 RepID=UPI000A2AC80E|nr:hypothetical protein [Bacillus sp. OV166]SMQ60990.1 hypothetical protein SAMN05444673_0450 [Bacillus sp. OV166]